MNFKKKRILSTLNDKNYYDLTYDNDDELIKMVITIVKFLNENVIYLSFYIKDDFVNDHFKDLKQFIMNKKVLYELKDYNLLNVLLNTNNINKIRHLNIYFLRNHLSEDAVNYSKFDYDYEIYFENYLEETVFGGKKEYCNNLINSIIKNI